jgi:uncharacterized protein (DUF2252 family)
MKTKKNIRRQNLSSQSRPSLAELYAMGKSLRKKCPRSSHAVWKAPSNRPDPLRLLEQSNQGRIARLIPIRIGRMVRTPFTFYRGAALNMAVDLAGTPATGLRVQACGDCHLHNFGAYATPERRIVFDINDLDETLPAPWEWDIKRLATSFVLASRDNGLSRGDARDAALSCLRAYRKRMAEYSDMTVLEIWYASIDIEKMISGIEDAATRRRGLKRFATSRARSMSERHFPKLAIRAGRSPTIQDDPPLIYHPRARGGDSLPVLVREAIAGYRKSLPEDRRALLERFDIADIALKVVGVGSVGTWCAVALMTAGKRDHLFLQMKEAGPSVLEAYAGKSIFPNHGQRVVNGCHLMQSASDIFLGWLTTRHGRHFYVRQLRDVKLGAPVEQFGSGKMLEYADFCGWTLARAHARSGASAQISGYLGKSDAFDTAVAAFAEAYADQCERDYAIFKKAVRSGHVKAVME